MGTFWLGTDKGGEYNADARYANGCVWLGDDEGGEYNADARYANGCVWLGDDEGGEYNADARYAGSDDGAAAATLLLLLRDKEREETPATEEDEGKPDSDHSSSSYSSESSSYSNESTVTSSGTQTDNKGGGGGCLLLSIVIGAITLWIYSNAHVTSVAPNPEVEANNERARRVERERVRAICAQTERPVSPPMANIGAVNGEFWYDRMQSRVRHMDYSEQVATEVGGFKIDQALDVLLDLAKQKSSAESTAGWQTPDCVPDSPLGMLQIQRTLIPILATPAFVDEHLVVPALARQGEFYPVFQILYKPIKIVPPTRAAPDDGGTKWALVRTNGYGDGWLYVQGGSAIVAARQILPTR